MGRTGWLAASSRFSQLLALCAVLLISPVIASAQSYRPVLGAGQQVHLISETEWVSLSPSTGAVLSRTAITTPLKAAVVGFISGTSDRTTAFVRQGYQGQVLQTPNSSVANTICSANGTVVAVADLDQSGVLDTVCVWSDGAVLRWRVTYDPGVYASPSFVAFTLGSALDIPRIVRRGDRGYSFVAIRPSATGSGYVQLEMTSPRAPVTSRTVPGQRVSPGGTGAGLSSATRGGIEEYLAFLETTSSGTRITFRRLNGTVALQGAIAAGSSISSPLGSGLVLVQSAGGNLSAYRAEAAGLVKLWSTSLAAIGTGGGTAQPRTTTSLPKGVNPVRPPADYAVPVGARVVHNGNELASALSATTPTTIVLADGTYASTSYFTNACGHRLFAQHRGKAVLTSGLAIGSNFCSGGAVVQGLTFQVMDPTRVLEQSVIHVWGRAVDARLSDIVVVGGGKIVKGLDVAQTQGFQGRRLQLSGFTGMALLIRQSHPTIPVVLEDIHVSSVAAPIPGSSNGTSESCLWLAARTMVTRARAENCAWAGIWTGGAAAGSRLIDVQVDRTVKPGIYLEHFSDDIVIDGVIAGPNLKAGAICEWADPAWGGRPACRNVVIQRGYFNTSCYGVFLDEGTVGSTVRTSTFLNQGWTAIGNFRGTGNLNDTAGNDYSGIRSVATAISPAHPWGQCN